MAGKEAPVKRRRRVWPWLLATALLLIYVSLPDVRDSVNRAAGLLGSGNTAMLRDFLLGFGFWGPVVSIALMVLQAILLPLPAFIITFTNAWLYGLLWGAVLSWSGAMLAAVICFYLARWLGRPVVERLLGNKSLAAADDFLARHGGKAVLLARLIPVISFDLVSYAAGLTSMNLWGFFWATGLGQLPATIVYSVVGENLGSGVSSFLWGLAAVFVMVFLGAAYHSRRRRPAQDRR